MVNNVGSDRKRIYKNSIKLYLRTFYTLIVGLYNSRVVLEVLGIDDFGIYSLVGSIVIMFSFFTSTMSSAMSRFFAFELAGGNERRLYDTFGTSLIIVTGISALLLTVGEIAGSMFLGHLNIQPESRDAAAVVYQLALATSMVSVIQTCFTSVIIAHERMGTFALLDMLTTTLKLAAIFLLKYVGGEKLILYSWLVFGVTASTSLATIIYCRYNFAECKAFFIWRKELFRYILSYSGWNMFKTLCDTLRPAGINILINLFFGVMVNGAVGIAMNVSSNLAKFTANVFMAFKPQIIKTYAVNAIDKMSELMSDTLRFSMLVLSLMMVPLFLEMPFVLNLWLGECPEYAAIFCRLLCIAMFFEVTIGIVEFGINATGNIRLFCITNGLMTISTVGLGWIAFRFGAPPQAIYVIQIVMGCLTSLTDTMILHKLVPEIKIGSIVSTVSGMILMSAVILAICLGIQSTMEEGFVRFVIVGFSDVLITAAAAYLFILPKQFKDKIKSGLRRKLPC